MIADMTRRRNRVTKWVRMRRDAEPREWIVDTEASLSLLDLVEVVSLEVRSTIHFIFEDDDVIFEDDDVIFEDDDEE